LTNNQLYSQFNHFKIRHHKPIEYKPDNNESQDFTKEELEALEKEPQWELLFSYSWYLPVIQYDSASASWTLVPHLPEFKELKNIYRDKYKSRDTEQITKYLEKQTGGQKLEQLAVQWEEYLGLPYGVKILEISATTLDKKTTIPVKAFHDDKAEMTKVTWDTKNGNVVRLTVIYKVPTKNIRTINDRNDLTNKYFDIDLSIIEWDNSFASEMIREIITNTKKHPKHQNHYQVASFIQACKLAVNKRFQRVCDNSLSSIYWRSDNTYEEIENFAQIDCDQNVLYQLENIFEKLDLPFNWRVWELVDWKGLKPAAHAWFEVNIDWKKYPVELTPPKY